MRTAGLLVCLALLVPAPALAADPTPSAKDLWKNYPLRPHPQPTTTTPATAPARRAPAQPAHDSGSGVTAALLAALAVAAAGGIGAFAWLRLRGRGLPSPQVHALVPLASGMPAVLVAGGPRGPALAAAQARRPAGSGPRRAAKPARVHRGPPPPDPARAWTAEIQWRPSESGSAFWVIAEAADGSARAPIAQSSTLEWPPRNPGAVQALSAAADVLEVALVNAGWKPLPPGNAWYSKRFRWDPVEAKARAAEPSGRFKRDAAAWPDEARQLWRCEIKWDSGYLSSRFQAVVYPPGGKPGRPAAASKAFKLMFMGEPDPQGDRYRAEARALATAMETAGWEPIGRGRAWYAERFVWRREGEPPEHVDPVPGEAEPAA